MAGRQRNNRAHSWPEKRTLGTVRCSRVSSGLGSPPAVVERDRSATKCAILSILFVMFVTAGSSAAESPVDDALLISARKSLPQEFSTNEIARVLQTGLWNSNRTAVAVSFLRPKSSVIFVFLRQTNGTYLAAEASGVEDGNFGKLGIAGRVGYDRFETTPVRWLHRDDGWFQVVMRTRAWKAGQRYTVAEPLLIKPDGTVLYR